MFLADTIFGEHGGDRDFELTFETDGVGFAT
jgi:hypothetical protein